MVLTVPLILGAIWARIDQGSWFAPGAFFSLVWVVYVMLPLVVAPDLEVWPGVIVAIGIATFVLYTGTVMGVGGIRVRSSQAHQAVQIQKDVNYFDAIKIPNMCAVLKYGTLFCGILGSTAVMALVKSEGYELNDLISLDAISFMAQSFSRARYVEDYRPPAIVQLSLVFMYASALFGGALLASLPAKSARLLAFFPFVPAIFFTAVQTTRSAMLFQIVYWISAYCGMKIFINGAGEPLFTKRFILLVPIVGCAAFLGFSTVLLARHGLSLDLLAPIIWPRFRGDIVGHLVAFGEWLRLGKYANLDPTFGAITFGGIFEAISIRRRVLGIYEDVIDIGLEEFATDTNIYTVFRGLIEDFTLPGTLAILFLIGLVAGCGYRMAARRAVVGIPLLVSFYWFALWSPIAAVTTYNSLIVAYLIFALSVLLCPGEKRSYVKA
jgi:oligosaccharide repeat unit polymerase